MGEILPCLLWHHGRQCQEPGSGKLSLQPREQQFELNPATAIVENSSFIQDEEQNLVEEVWLGAKQQVEFLRRHDEYVRLTE